MNAAHELNPVNTTVPGHERYLVRDPPTVSTPKPSPRWPVLVRERAAAPARPGPAPAVNSPCESDPHLHSKPSPDAETKGAPDAETNGINDTESSTHLCTDPEPGADPDSEPDDELYLLGERCAEVYLQADALHYQAMKLLAEFHRRDGWQGSGFSSTAEWLAWRIGITLGAARERLRTALALEHLPLTSEAMKNGEISFTKVRALTRAATPESEATLLDFARAGSAANLERVIRGWSVLDRRSEVTAEQIRYRSRRLSAFVDDDGMVVVNGRLDPEAGALFMRAVEAATDALYRKERRNKGKGDDDTGDASEDGAGAGDFSENLNSGRRSDADKSVGLEETTPEQRRADGLGLMAERALAAGFGKDGNGDEMVSGSQAERYQVMLHVDAHTLSEDGEPGESELEDGTRVSAETSRRVACDSGVVRITHAPGGEVIGARRRTRTVSPSLRRALEARDRGCRFPGCGSRFTDAHHVKHWADGGETTLRNLVLLCRTHHRAVHEGGVDVWMDMDGQVVFFTPKGKALMGAPLPEKNVTARPLELEPVESGDEPGGHGELKPYHRSGGSRWRRDSDIPWQVEARAWEALEAASEPAG